MRIFEYGSWKNLEKFTADDALRICAEGTRIQIEIAEYSMAKIYDLFDAIRKKWRDPEYEHRKLMQKQLPELTGFSGEMIRMGLDEMDFLFDPEILQKKFDTELRGIPRGMEYQYDPRTQRMLRWHPLGVVLHVLSGNVFLVGPGSLIEGLLTGNVTLLKQSSAENIFMPVFLDSLMECEKELGHAPVVSRSICLLEYPSSSTDVIDVFKKHVDGMAIWGGESAVQAYRNDVPARTRVIVFGPKLSVAIVSPDNNENISSAASHLATELSVWDQNACTAPQICFVKGKENAQALAKELSLELDKSTQQFPGGTPDPNQSAEIRKWRTIAEIMQARGEGALYESPTALDWTVVYDEGELSIDTSPLNRTIKIFQYDDISEVTRHIADMRAYIQTVGIEASPAQSVSLAYELGKRGVLRTMPLGKMGGEDIDDPHDGAYDLPLFMNLVVSKLALPHKSIRPFELYLPKDRDRLILEKLQTCVRRAKHHPYYKDKLEDVTLGTLDDFEEIDFTPKADFEKNVLPTENDIDWQGGYVTRSGGSTGEPNFSYFNHHDWMAMVDNAVDVFRSCGFDENDRIANFLFAGDLYGSFISFNDVNRNLGMTSFPFAGVIDEQVLLNVYKKFAFNCMQGFPAVILPLLRKLIDKEPQFRIEKIMYAGQPMSENDKNWLRQNVGAKVIASVIGTTEAGQIGYQSQSDSGKIHTAVDDYNYLEIVDDEGKAVPFGEVGHILVTSLTKTDCPVIRYKIGDQGRFVPTEADEGGLRQARRFEYLGRSDSVLAIGPMKAEYNDFNKCMTTFGISLLQLVASFQDGRDHLTVNVETEHQNPDLEKQIYATLMRGINELEEFISEQKLGFTLNILAPGKLKRTSRTGKVKLIIDERFDT